MIRITEAVKHLIIINAIFFLATVLNQNIIYDWLALWFPEHSSFRIWQLVSHFFMHGSMGHLFFNMLGIWMFGSMLEQKWGKQKFLFFYFSAGLGAGVIHILANYYYFNDGVQLLAEVGVSKQDILNLLQEGKYDTRWEELVNRTAVNRMIESFMISAVGASGALYGILVAFAFLFPNMELMMLFLPIPIKAKYFVPGLILIDIISGLSHANTGTAHFAHVGGAIIGFLMMWYWKKNSFNQKRWN